MNKFKTVITYWGIANLIVDPIYLLFIWLMSFGDKQGTIPIITNHFGERLIETIMLLTGVPCALYVVYPIVKKFTEPGIDKSK